MQESSSTTSMLDRSQVEQDGSSLHPTSRAASLAPPEAPPDNESTANEEIQPKKKGRKGHSKSRTGCLNCKRARIKCKENKPACDYCAHRDLNCEWPELKITQQQQQIVTSSLNSNTGSIIRHFNAEQLDFPVSVHQTIQLQIPVFTMQDFRLFYFFREHAYPHHPIGNDSVWRNEIPSIAHNHDFLLHSMLGLSASELACSTDPTAEMHSTALTHRVKAISCLNSAISRGISSFEEGNAMLATCFSLLFQSCLLEDGLVEYMMFIRGTVSIGIAMGLRQMRFLFERIWGDEQVEQIDPLMDVAPQIQPEIVAAANRSFERFRPLCQSKVELDAYLVLSSIARALTTSSRDAYMNLRKMYELFSYTMTQPEFQAYCNTSNVACQLLQAHFVALQLIMSPVTRVEFTFKEMETGKSDDGNGKTVAWLVGIHKRVPSDLIIYFPWTMWVEKEVLSGRLYSGRMTAKDLGGLDEVMKAWNDDWTILMNVQEESS